MFPFGLWLTFFSTNITYDVQKPRRKLGSRNQMSHHIQSPELLTDSKIGLETKTSADPTLQVQTLRGSEQLRYREIQLRPSQYIQESVDNKLVNSGIQWARISCRKLLKLWVVTERWTARSLVDDWMLCLLPRNRRVVLWKTAEVEAASSMALLDVSYQRTGAEYACTQNRSLIPLAIYITFFMNGLLYKHI